MLPLLVTAAVIMKEGQVLLTRRPVGSRHAGYWEFPGGKVMAGESPEDALGREMKEELDVEVDVGRIYEVAYYRYDWGPVLILAYQCQIKNGGLKNVEVAEHRWVNYSDLSTYRILPADAPIVNCLMATPHKAAP